MILKVAEDGTYTLIPGRASREDFITAIEVYRRAAAIKRAARADRKAVIEAMVLNETGGVNP